VNDAVTDDAVALAERIRAGSLGEREVVEAAIQRIEEHNGSLNAVVATRFDNALAEVDRGLPDGPLRGVPVLIKDLGVDVADLPATNGSRLFADNIATHDSEIVRRYRRAGMVVLGTTNTPEFGKNGSTEPALFGPTRNPHSHEHSPGGSSGGSAAAVAAGMVPVAHGSDGGGSLRIPAAMCGLVGLKPSRGQVPTAPHPTALANPLTVHHAVSTSVRDSATLLDIVAGAVAGSPYGAPHGPLPYADEIATAPRQLRIGYTTTAGDGTVADAECAAAVRQAADDCAALGHEVTHAAPDYDAATAGSVFSVLMRAPLAGTVEDRLRELGRGLRPDDLEPLTRRMVDYAREMPAHELMRALADAERVGWDVGRFFAEYDLLLTPTVAAVTPPLGTLDTSDPEGIRRQGGVYSSFTSVFNVTGQPAISLPFGATPQGLPLGVQFVGAHGDDALLLRLAAQLEHARPWR